jgi:glycerate 2-kinase
MKILIAPNSFKECASSIEVSNIIHSVLYRNGFTDLVKLPLSDGGDGFLEICKAKFDLDDANWTVDNITGEGATTVPVGITKNWSKFYFEVADVIGMKVVPVSKRNPNLLNTSPVGELLLKLEEKSQNQLGKVILGIGGTATSDLGLGLCSKFGLKLFDRNDKQIEVHPKNYYNVNRIELPRKISLTMEAIIDVEIPLIGNNGCNKIFASQKGAAAEDINALEAGAKRIIYLLKKDHGLDFYRVKNGAGGGLLLGLSLLGKVSIKHSTTFLAKDLGMNDFIAESDLVITGEGAFDEQSFMKKAAGIVVSEAFKKGKKVALMVGKNFVSFDAFKDNPPIILELMAHYPTKEESILDFKNGIETLTKILINKIKM